MENKAYVKPMYKCALCGKEYDSVAQRINCEQTCLHKQEEEARMAAARKKAAEYEARKKEVDEAFNAAYALKNKFVQDYGCYTYNQPVDSVCLFDWFKI